MNIVIKTNFPHNWQKRVPDAVSYCLKYVLQNNPYMWEISPTKSFTAPETPTIDTSALIHLWCWESLEFKQSKQIFTQFWRSWALLYRWSTGTKKLLPCYLKLSLSSRVWKQMIHEMLLFVIEYINIYTQYDKPI